MQSYIPLLCHFRTPVMKMTSVLQLNMVTIYQSRTFLIKTRVHSEKSHSLKRNSLLIPESVTCLKIFLIVSQEKKFIQNKEIFIHINAPQNISNKLLKAFISLYLGTYSGLYTEYSLTQVIYLLFLAGAWWLPCKSTLLDCESVVARYIYASNSPPSTFSSVD